MPSPSRESGDFPAYAGELRRLEKLLHSLSKELRDHAQRNMDRELKRAREEGELAAQVEHLTSALEDVRKRLDAHIDGHDAPLITSLVDTGPNAPRGEVAIAQADALRAQASKDRAQTSLWLKIAAVFGAGGLGAAVTEILRKLGG